MQWTKSLALTLALGIAAPMFAVSALAEDKPAETKPEEKPKKEAKAPRLVNPWSKLKSLTAEQKAKIDEIHKKSLAERKKIEEQEEADITALLTDEQKLELKTLKEEEGAKRKAAAAEKAKPEKEKEEDKKDGM